MSHCPTCTCEDHLPEVKPGVLGTQGLTVGELRTRKCIDCGAAAWPHPYRHPVRLLSGHRLHSGSKTPPVSRSQMKLPTGDDD